MTDPKMRPELFAESNAKEADLLDWLNDFAPFLKLPDGAISSLHPRWAAIARTHFEEGFMALNKAIAGGGRTSA